MESIALFIIEISVKYYSTNNKNIQYTNWSDKSILRAPFEREKDKGPMRIIISFKIIGEIISNYLRRNTLDRNVRKMRYLIAKIIQVISRTLFYLSPWYRMSRRWSYELLDVRPWSYRVYHGVNRFRCAICTIYMNRTLHWRSYKKSVLQYWSIKNMQFENRPNKSVGSLYKNEIS